MGSAPSPGRQLPLFRSAHSGTRGPSKTRKAGGQAGTDPSTRVARLDKDLTGSAPGSTHVAAASPVPASATSATMPADYNSEVSSSVSGEETQQSQTGDEDGRGILLSGLAATQMAEQRDRRFEDPGRYESADTGEATATASTTEPSEATRPPRATSAPRDDPAATGRGSSRSEKTRKIDASRKRSLPDIRERSGSSSEASKSSLSETDTTLVRETSEKIAKGSQLLGGTSTDNSRTNPFMSPLPTSLDDSSIEIKIRGPQTHDSRPDVYVSDESKSYKSRTDDCKVYASDACASRVDESKTGNINETNARMFDNYGRDELIIVGNKVVRSKSASSKPVKLKLERDKSEEAKSDRSKPEESKAESTKTESYRTSSLKTDSFKSSAIAKHVESFTHDSGDETTSSVRVPKYSMKSDYSTCEETFEKSLSPFSTSPSLSVIPLSEPTSEDSHRNRPRKDSPQVLSTQNLGLGSSNVARFHQAKVVRPAEANVKPTIGKGQSSVLARRQEYSKQPVPAARGAIASQVPPASAVTVPAAGTGTGTGVAAPERPAWDSTPVGKPARQTAQLWAQKTREAASGRVTKLLSKASARTTPRSTKGSSMKPERTPPMDSTDINVMLPMIPSFTDVPCVPHQRPLAESSSLEVSPLQESSLCVEFHKQRPTEPTESNHQADSGGNTSQPPETTTDAGGATDSAGCSGGGGSGKGNAGQNDNRKCALAPYHIRFRSQSEARPQSHSRSLAGSRRAHSPGGRCP